MPNHPLKQSPGPLTIQPAGFRSFIANAGIKDHTNDLGVVVSDQPARAAAMFTRNKVAGNPVKVGRKHIKNGRIRALVVNSKNSNVATGREGYEAALQVCGHLAGKLGCDITEVFPSSTGVIGRPFPAWKIIEKLNDLPEALTRADFEAFAGAIMTTDTFAKYISVRAGSAVITGIAKGSGMIEPNMATMLSYFFTDADISHSHLRKILKKVVNRTFNCLSVDSDTSTSDTVMIMANGMAGKVNLKEFEAALFHAAETLTRLLAIDGEGATKLFVVDVKGARDRKEALRIGKSIINSPLVKTAIYKGDPNWGRIFMAVGKTPGIKVRESDIRIFWGGRSYSNEELADLTRYLTENHELNLTVHVGQGRGNARVYGCDLTEEYVEINAYYTT